MGRAPFVSLSFAAATLVCLVLPAVPGYWLPAGIRVAVAAAGLLLLPGALLLRLFGPGDVTVGERPALCFVSSLAVATAPWIWTVATSGGLDDFSIPLLCTVFFLALACAVVETRTGRRATAHPPRHDSYSVVDSVSGGVRVSTGRIIVAAIVALVVLDTLAAWKFTGSGSVDRWWYLAYVRKWRDASPIDFGEPFFGSGYVPPRFGFNVWLLAMAAWGDLSGTDPVWLYERACPLLLIPVAFSSLYFFARSVLGSRLGARLAVVAGGLLWAGGTLIPAGTRIPEDKILAWLIVMPLSLGSLVRMLRQPSVGSAAVLAVCVLVQATIHPLVYALLLLVAVPYAALALVQRAASPAAAVLALSLLAAGAIYPVTAGLGAREAARRRGAAEITSTESPIARVHTARNRLLQLDDELGFIVHPRLLARPILVLALGCLLIVAARGGDPARFLLPATLLPLAAAFIPPLPKLAGHVLLPWMVYRLLWAIPFALLLGAGLEQAVVTLQRRQWLPVVLVVATAAPWSAVAWQQRARAERRALEVPSGGPLRQAMSAVQALPRTAVIAAPIELAERIPTLAGRHVVAISDRGTLVFSSDAAQAAERLRLRAEILAGVAPFRARNIRATHALFAPGRPAARRCRRAVFQEDGFVLCRLRSHGAGRPPPRLIRLAAEPAGAVLDVARSLALARGASHGRLQVDCDPMPDHGNGGVLRWPRPGPWSAAAAQVLCKVSLQAGGQAASFIPSALTLEPVVGRAREELLVRVSGERSGTETWVGVERIEAGGPKMFVLALPAHPIDRLRIEITPTNLPFVKLRSLRLTYR